MKIYNSYYFLLSWVREKRDLAGIVSIPPYIYIYAYTTLSLANFFPNNIHISYSGVCNQLQ